jgi:hypothetical protein
VGRVKTVVISTKNGPVVINESDFDKSKDKLHAPRKKPVRRKAAVSG